MTCVSERVNEKERESGSESESESRERVEGNSKCFGEGNDFGGKEGNKKRILEVLV